MLHNQESVSEPYSGDQIDKIIAAVRFPVDASKRADLKKRLKASATNYLDEKNDPTPAKLRDRLRAIEKTAGKLLNALGAGQEADPSTLFLVHLYMAALDLPEQGSAITRSGFRQVKEPIEGVRSLQRWAAHAAAEVHKKINPRGKSRDMARLYFAVDLAEIYKWAFGRNPGVSRHPVTAEPRGPFIRFLDACFKELGDTLTLEAVAKWARLAKDWDWGIIEITNGDGRVLYSRDSSQ